MRTGRQSGQRIFTVDIGDDARSVRELELDARNSRLHALQRTVRRIAAGRQIAILLPVSVEVGIDLSEDDALVAEDAAVALDAYQSASLVGKHFPLPARLPEARATLASRPWAVGSTAAI